MKEKRSFSLLQTSLRIKDKLASACKQTDEAVMAVTSSLKACVLWAENFAAPKTEKCL